MSLSKRQFIQFCLSLKGSDCHFLQSELHFALMLECVHYTSKSVFFGQALGLKQYRVPPNSHFELYCHLLYASLPMLRYVGVRLIASSCLNSVCKQAHRLTHPYSHTLRPHRWIWIVWCLCTNQINILFENWEPHTFTWKTFPCVHQS